MLYFGIPESRLQLVRKSLDRARGEGSLMSRWCGLKIIPSIVDPDGADYLSVRTTCNPSSHCIHRLGKLCIPDRDPPSLARSRSRNRPPRYRLHVSPFSGQNFEGSLVATSRGIPYPRPNHSHLACGPIDLTGTGAMSADSASVAFVYRRGRHSLELN